MDHREPSSEELSETDMWKIVENSKRILQVSEDDIKRFEARLDERRQQIQQKAKLKKKDQAQSIFIENNHSQ